MIGGGVSRTWRAAAGIGTSARSSATTSMDFIYDSCSEEKAGCLTGHFFSGFRARVRPRRLEARKSRDDRSVIARAELSLDDTALDPGEDRLAGQDVVQPPADVARLQVAPRSPPPEHLAVFR